MSEPCPRRSSLDMSDFDLLEPDEDARFTNPAPAVRSLFSFPSLQTQHSTPQMASQITTKELRFRQKRAVTQFLGDFGSRVWFTYRSSFPRIRPSSLTSDPGPGCMIRTAQMMVCEAFVCHFLGRGWRMQGADIAEFSMHLQLIRWFGDSPSPLAPYSIHNVTRLGARFNKKIGECFEPSQVARCFKILVRKHRPGNITMYAPRDAVISLAELKSLCQVEEPSKAWRPVILMLSVRLGIDQRVNPAYIPALKSFLTLPQSIGIVGGKPNQSLWFVAFQDDHVMYFDPHLVQDSLDVEGDTFDPRSYHWRYPQKMLFRDMDPSLAVGFFCADRTQVEDLCTFIQSFNASSSAPVFSVIEDHVDPSDEHRFESDELDLLPSLSRDF